MYNLVGICLALTALLMVNVLGSLLAASGCRVVSRFAKNWSAAAQARLYFICRILPPAVALLAAIVLFVPSYLVYEPRQTDEIVGLKLGLVTLLSVTGIALAIWRGLATWFATRRLVDDWLKHSQPIRLADCPINVFRIDHQFPVVAVIGVFRPKMFVAGRVIDSLTPDEISAVIVHEKAHVAARDNLKHWLMRICRDVLVIFPSGHSIDRKWAEAIELAADEGLAGADALSLADALIKIARMVRGNIKPAMPVGMYALGAHVRNSDILARRIRRLTKLADHKLSPFENHWREWLVKGASWTVTGLFLIGAVTVAMNQTVLAAVHSATEQIFRALN